MFAFLFGAGTPARLLTLLILLCGLSAPLMAAEMPTFNWVPIPGNKGVAYLFDKWVPNSPQTQGAVGSITFHPPERNGVGYIRYGRNSPDAFYRVVEETKWYVVLLMKKFNSRLISAPFSYTFRYFQPRHLKPSSSDYSTDYGYCANSQLTPAHFSLPDDELREFWRTYAHCNPMARPDPRRRAATGRERLLVLGLVPYQHVARECGAGAGGLIDRSVMLHFLRLGTKKPAGQMANRGGVVVMKVFAFLFGARNYARFLTLLILLCGLSAPLAAADMPTFNWVPIPGNKGVAYLFDKWVPNSPQTQGAVGTMTFHPPERHGVGYIRYGRNSPDEFYRVVEETKWYVVLLVKELNTGSIKTPFGYTFQYFQPRHLKPSSSDYSTDYGHCGNSQVTQDQFSAPDDELREFWRTYAHCNPMAQPDPTHGFAQPLGERDYWYNGWSTSNMWRASAVPVPVD